MRKKRKGIRLSALLLLLSCVTLPLIRLPERGTHGPVPRPLSVRVEFALRKSREEALQELIPVKKTYRLAPGTLAPAPKTDGYGILHSGEELCALYAQAQTLLDGREPLLTPQTPFDAQKGIHYYYDESILTLLWYQTVTETDLNWDHDATMVEVFLSDASQFRRKLSGNSFGSGIFTYPTDMALEENAVFASSGDFYGYRPQGFCVYEGKLQRLLANRVDTCAIDDKGDLLFIPASTILTEDDANAYIQNNKVNFTLSFGPILVENHETVVHTDYYPLGEAYERYPRLILGQVDSLHYVEMAIRDHTTAFAAGEILREMGVERCYALDGGQTATFVLNGTVMNPNLYGAGNSGQRTQSDIIYFVSAVEN